MKIDALRRAAMAAGLLMILAAFGIPDKPVPDQPDGPAARISAPEQTPTPAPEPEAVIWVRYPVPLEDEMQRYINGLCAEKNIDPAIIYAVISMESDFQEDKLGDGGQSFGLMQIWQSEHTERCIRLGAWNLLDARSNVRVGIDYLAELIGWGYGLDYALSWYNGHGGELPWWYVDEVHARAEKYAEGAITVAE